ncbi:MULTISPECIES: hypothetical protein [Marinobacter]|uniref:hypothetical protein n=1 Tax=Marinobacter TaxID=2742 RepID=UPI001B02800D|nr:MULTISPECIES: hypothetical protein [Marinobacter]MBO6810865.1 hypothetical protein [Marinobacter sp.]MBO6872894.1 hypothetical protein [Marinobacter sp.]MBY6071208.1 hypothetical protein [Marinobacter salsuginis]
MRYLLVLLVTLLFSAPALSGQCPTLMKEVDSQMESADLDASTKAEVAKLRAKGESLHKEGKHGESERVLRQAIETIDAAVEQAAGT